MKGAAAIKLSAVSVISSSLINAAVRLCQALKVITGILKSKLKLAGGPEELIHGASRSFSQF